MSDLLNQASLVYIPSGYKEDTAYTVIPTDGSGDLTFTRASDGTRVNSQGLVERVPWNLLEQSNTLSNAAWYDFGTSETGGQAGYDGTNDAWKLTRVGAFNYLAQDITTSGVQTFSVYAKADTFNWLLLRFQRSTTTYAGYYFDLANGVVGSADGSGVIDTSVTSVGGGWNRISITFNETLLRVLFYPVPSNGGVASLGSGSVIVQDAQLNEGSTAKPYFPTTDRLNVPRLDYSNGCPSLLLEPQRTNLLQYSEQFDNAYWAQNNTVTTANQTTSPDGIQNADKVIDNSTTTQHTITRALSISTGTYTWSVFFKAAEFSTCALRLGTGSLWNGGEGPTVEFDLTTQTSTPVEGVGITYGIENYGNGWYRCHITGTCVSAGTTYPSVFVKQYNPYSGSGNGLYIWGAQLEAGAYPTSYIPTTSASVTRVADAASKTGISSLIGQTEGTFLIDFIASSKDADAGGPYSVLFTAGVAGNNFQIYTNSGALKFYKEPSTIDFLSSLTLVEGQRYKIAYAYKSGQYAFYANGVQLGTDANTSVPTASAIYINQFSTGTYQAKNNFNQVLLFKTRLTNAELAALTTL